MFIPPFIKPSFRGVQNETNTDKAKRWIPKQDDPSLNS